MENLTDITYMSDKDLNDLLGYDDTEVYKCEDCRTSYRASEDDEKYCCCHICPDCGIARSEKMEKQWEADYKAYGEIDPEGACLTDAEYYI